MLSVGSLFAGIGGFDLGLQRTGEFETKWFVENDRYCQLVLAKHWPGVTCYSDICEVGNLPFVDVLCGGFPCQNISSAGDKTGIDGEKSSLWYHFARIISEIRPRYVIVENVSSLRTRGLDRVVSDLMAMGYDSEWACIRASEIGAPHQRDRIWILAYSDGSELWDESGQGLSRPQEAPVLGDNSSGWNVADAVSNGWREGRSERGLDSTRGWATAARDSSGAGAITDPYSVRPDWRPRVFESRRWTEFEDLRSELGRAWSSESGIRRVAFGVSRRMDRLKCLGNSLVPQIAQLIGQGIVEWEKSQMMTPS